MDENENPAAVEAGAVAEPIVAAEPPAVTPLHNVVNAVEVLINVIRQLSGALPALSGLAGYANQVEYWIKAARADLDPQPVPPAPIPAPAPAEPEPAS